RADASGGQAASRPQRRAGGRGETPAAERHGPAVAYRADMDAVPGDAGPAHLCGHDVHTAIGVGVGQVLARLRDRFSGRVMLVFQPAEETLEGARAMIASGVLEPVAPQEFYALHSAPLPVGEFAVMPGFGLPGLDTGHIDLSGPDAVEHARRLKATIDGWATVPYPQNPEDIARMLHDSLTPDGPLSRFVVGGGVLEPRPQGTRVRFWFKAWPDERYHELRDDIRRLAGSVDGARVEFAPEPFPAMVCSPSLSEAAAAYMRGVPGLGPVTVLHASFPFNGEDFALFLRHVPGAMFYLGVGVDGMPHSPGFAADDRAIGVGVRTMTGLLLDRLHKL
uniref:M20 metallopeptidase family protein n=1 Tax=Allorhizocola rhizosphaerae TaxID=1872709 RepID=UPI0013C2E128